MSRLSKLLILIALFLPIGLFADTTSTLRPTADGGEDSANWEDADKNACSTNDCYTEVDESSGSSCTNSDGDTTYLASSTSGAAQTFDINESSIADDSTITAIDITVCYKNKKAGEANDFQTRRCIDGSCTNSGTNIAIGDTYTETTQSHTGLSITKTSSTDLEIGMAVIGTTVKDIRISQISVTITYTSPDTTAPDAVSNLATGSVGQTSIPLSWSAPGDDGSTGTATTYDVRYSTSNITAGNFSSATAASGEPSPSVAGTTENFTVTGLTASTGYYFALKTDDEVPNTSTISNAVFATTSNVPDTTAPNAVTDLALSNADSDSIDLAWTAPGDDGSTGTASTYDIRYSTAAINDGNWASATAVSGEPTPSVAGSSESITVSSLTAATTYHFALKTSDESANESTLSNIPSLATTAQSTTSTTVSTSGGSTARKVSFSGQAYPKSTIEVLRKSLVDEIFRNTPIESSSIDSQGIFDISYIALIGGEYFFALRAEDKDGRKTGIISFDTDLGSDNFLIVKDIFIPPTIGFKSVSVKKGADLEVEGYAAPKALLSFEVDGESAGEVKSLSDGYYSISIPTPGLSLGTHQLRVSQTINNSISGLSFPKTFKISTLSIPRADFNSDDKVDITDWSIFLSRWGSEDARTKDKIDIDQNGVVDIVDFSLFLEAIKG